MKLFLYYGIHSIKNQIKKLFKTWIMVFILICVLFGGLIGFGAAVLTDLAEEQSGTEIATETASETDTEDEDFAEDEPEIFGDMDHVPLAEMTEAIAGAIALVMFILLALFSDKSGSKIFQPADVNILFASPMKPQSVLLFRLSTQLGAMLLMTIYMMFQLPNLIWNVGMSVWSGVAMIFAWTIVMMIGSLIQLALYMVGATHPQHRGRIRMALYGVIAITVGAFGLWKKQTGEGIFPAVISFFGKKEMRWIPLWGWLKGFCYHAAAEEWMPALGYMIALIAGILILVWLIWRFKADFYEDAMYKAQELAEIQEKMNSDRAGAVGVMKRKKDRSEKLKRDGFHKGWGANVFFHKAMYNRFRFGYLKYFTKTTFVYLFAGIVQALFCRWVLGIRDAKLLPLMGILAALIFFRSLGNPLEEDTKMDFFRLIPESPWAKMFWSLMGGTVNCLLDLLPAVIISPLLMGENPLVALAWIPFLISVDFYATSVGVFIDLSVNVSAGKIIKQLVQIMFIYFGLLPDILIFVLCGIFLNTTVGAIIAAVVNCAFGILFFVVSPLFIEPGRGK